MKQYLLENPQVVVTLIIGIVGLIITYWYNKNNLKIANQKMEKELFNEFNRRYDKLNDYLEIIRDKLSPNNDMSLDDLKKVTFDIKEGETMTFEMILIDYFNLCAEEYYWRKRKRISEEIWRSWQAGMKSYFEIEIVKKLWDEELKKFGYQSYYLNEGEGFFSKS
jgi:hypothetical protein